ncbi:MAG: hypothetical protein WCN95_08695 [bacterium]
MKRSIAVVILVAAMSLVMFGTWGCGSSDDDNGGADNGGGVTNVPVVIASIIGNWSLTGIEQAGVTAPSPYTVTLVIRNDDTLTWTVNGESIEGTYVKISSMFTMTFPTAPSMNQSHQYWLENNTLTLQMDVGNRYVFTKI